MITSKAWPKGFVEFHFVGGQPVTINVNMISFISEVAKDTDNWKVGKRCHILALGHNNGGFYVTETYKEVQETIRLAVEGLK